MDNLEFVKELLVVSDEGNSIDRIIAYSLTEQDFIDSIIKKYNQIQDNSSKDESLM